MNKMLSFFVLLFATFAQAQSPMNTNAKGVFLDGYDVVSYFTEGQAVRGQPAFQLQWQNTTLYFSSADHKQRFQAAPEQYFPQYNGHCANGLSDGHLVRANPEIFRIIDDRLYLFFSWWGKAQWKFDQQEQIQLATENWNQFSAEAASD